ncbi:MAG: hypothetical protein U0802_14400 [Candidatus Binatia bacterium]
MKLAGMRIEPPPSLAVASGSTPAAIAADEPPLEPPGGVARRSQGERVTPCRRLRVNAGAPNSGALVLPMTIAPAAFSRCTCTES